jgi:LacI family transcriptional regulator
MKQALRLFRQTTRPEAVFCWTDFVAFEVLSVARELGLHVPGDVAIMGHDNTAFCDLSIASMTSFDQSGPELGANAARLLIESIEGRTKSVFVTVAPKVVARGSTKMPRVEIAAQSKITGTEDIERFPRPRDNIPSRVR